jgi:hypothetical protein
MSDIKEGFKFAELSDQAKQNALNWMAQGNVQDWDPTDEIEHFINLINALGFWISYPISKNWAWSFGGQDDHVRFDGGWRKKDVNPLASPDLSTDLSTDDATILGIYAKLFNFGLAFPDNLSANINLSQGRTTTVEFVVFNYETPNDGGTDDPFEELNEAFGHIYHELCDWLTTQLAVDFEWQSDPERCEEDILANDYTFDEDGVVQ